VRGVFNVSGPPPLPLSVIAHAAGKRTLPVPEGLFRAMLGRFGLPELPQGAVEHIKFPIVIDSMRFKKTIGFRYTHDAEATIESFRATSG